MLRRRRPGALRRLVDEGDDDSRPLAHSGADGEGAAGASREQSSSTREPAAAGAHASQLAAQGQAASAQADAGAGAGAALPTGGCGGAAEWAAPQRRDSAAARLRSRLSLMSPRRPASAGAHDAYGSGRGRAAGSAPDADGECALALAVAAAAETGPAGGKGGGGSGSALGARASAAEVRRWVRKATKPEAGAPKPKSARAQLPPQRACPLHIGAHLSPAL